MLKITTMPWILTILLPRWIDAFAIKNTIYIKQDLWGSRVFESILDHEQTHLKQQKTYGVIRFLLLYFFQPQYRALFEIQAYRAEPLWFRPDGRTFCDRYHLSKEKVPIFDIMLKEPSP